jgi:hypothetical protein
MAISSSSESSAAADIVDGQSQAEDGIGTPLKIFKGLTRPKWVKIDRCDFCAQNKMAGKRGARAQPLGAGQIDILAILTDINEFLLSQIGWRMSLQGRCPAKFVIQPLLLAVGTG